MTEAATAPSAEAARRPAPQAFWRRWATGAASVLPALAGGIVALARRPRHSWAGAGLLAAAALYGVFGYYACWVAGLEGECLRFG